VARGVCPRRVRRLGVVLHRKDGAVATYRGRYLIMWHKDAACGASSPELYVWTSCSGEAAASGW